MTPEERFERIDRQLEFIAANQAQINTWIGENSQQIAENSRQIAEHSAQIGGLSDRIGQLSDLTLRIARIVDVQAHRMDELAASGRQSDERLSALITVVERYFSNGRN
jgi:methyl-accepting chemotaxis protein